MHATKRRQQLLEVTANIIANSGLDCVRIPDVAEGAGVTRPVVYKFFANREALIIAVLASFSEAFEASFRERLARSSQSKNLATISKACVEAALDTIEQQGPGGWYLLNDHSSYPELATHLKERHEKLRKPWVRRVTELNGVLDDEAKTLTHMLFSLTFSMVSASVNGIASDRELILEHVTRATRSLADEFITNRTVVAHAQSHAPRESGFILTDRENREQTQTQAFKKTRSA